MTAKTLFKATREFASPAGERLARRRIGLRAALVVAVVVAAAVVFGERPAVAQEDPVNELAERYAPVIMVKDQEGECGSDGEQYAPMAAEALLDNPQVFLRQVGPQDPVVMNGPGADDVFGLGEGFFLDFPGDALNPGCVFEQDFQRFTEGQPTVVYAHVATQDDEPDKLALQYWFFFYYNDWNNLHEGDWEGIQLLFDVGTVEEALTTDPVSAGYSQHYLGERVDWTDEKLERRETHPVVYTSAGSHASYYGEAVYLGRSGSEGFGCDDTDGPSLALEPEVVVLPSSVDDPDDPLAWLAFEGRWGERQSEPFNGPTGPATKQRWTEPVDWHDQLHTNSVVVPAGDQVAASIINSFCGIVEWGSSQILVLRQNPFIVFAAVIVGLGLLSVALGRTDWSRVAPLPIVRRRRAGQLIKAAYRIFVDNFRLFLSVGFVYVPIAIVVGAFTGLIRLIPIVGALIDTERDIGILGITLTFILGGLGHVAALTVVTAMVSVLLRDLEQGNAVSASGAIRETYERFGDLAAAFLRSFVVVGLLAISVVGLPWGIRQAVRYQFVAQATMLEDARRKAALDRSSTLVVGHWLHTAAVIVLLNGLVALFSLVVGMVVLVVFSGLPLWLFSILVSSFSVLVVPYTAIAFVLLYGDRVAEEVDAEPAAQLEKVGV